MIEDIKEIVIIIEKTIRESAKKAASDAGLGGYMHDGGASAMISKLEVWKDGVTFAHTGQSKVCGGIISSHEKEKDPQYQEYLRLKRIFEKEMK